MVYPRVNLLGGSMDFESETIGAAFRLEGAMTWCEEFANTLDPQLYSRNRVWRSVIGVDRPTCVAPFATNVAVFATFVQGVPRRFGYRPPPDGTLIAPRSASPHGHCRK